jgi:hypothetical protein
MRMFIGWAIDMERIAPSFPEFREMMLETLFQIASNRGVSHSFFRTLIAGIIDILVPCVNGPSRFLSIRRELMAVIQDPDKRVCLEECCADFVARISTGICEDKIDEADAYVFANDTVLHKIKYRDNEFLISSKTRYGTITHLASIPERQELVDSEKDASLIDFGDMGDVKCQTMDTFSHLVDQMLSEGVVRECTPGQFAFSPPTDNYEWGIMPLTDEGTPSFFQRRESVTFPRHGPLCLLKCTAASGLSSALFEDADLENMFIREPVGLSDIHAKSLYDLPVRECCKIGVLFVDQGQIDQAALFLNEFANCSPAFKSFLGSIGWLVDLAKHKGFDGKLDTVGFSSGRYQLYFANQRFEVLYHVAPLMPIDEDNEQQIYKKRHIGNDNVHIVWSEHEFDYDPQTVTSQFNDVHIVIYPVRGSSEFFRVQVYRKNVEYRFGPLWEESLVTARCLPDLVRWTAIFGDRVTRIVFGLTILPDDAFVEAVKGLKSVAPHD